MSYSGIPLCGPLAIHSFGVMIALGLALFTFFMARDKVCTALMPATALHNTILVGVVAALVGGRILAIAGDAELRHASVPEWLSLWDGGLSSLGCVIGVLVGWTLYLRYQKIPLLPFFDIAAVYMPIVHLCIRIGCFLAGCCYGSPTSALWGITYQDDAVLAPLGIPLHPTQLYSIGALLLIFACMLFLKNHAHYPGQLVGWYLILTNAERSIVDIFRGDREFVIVHGVGTVSLHQLIGCALALLGLGVLLWSYQLHRQRVRHEPL